MPRSTVALLLVLSLAACSDGRTPAEAGPPGPAPGAAAARADRGDAGMATVYVCPMHPEVTASHPGTCPKCGMTLVLQEAQAR